MLPSENAIYLLLTCVKALDTCPELKRQATDCSWTTGASLGLQLTVLGSSHGAKQHTQMKKPFYLKAKCPNGCLAWLISTITNSLIYDPLTLIFFLRG